MKVKLEIKILKNHFLQCLLFAVGMFFISSCSSGSGKNDPDPETPSVPSITPVAGNDLYGFIGDSKYNPISGVVVSDGYTSVQTDAKGVYQMKRNSNAKFVYYSIPSEYKVNTSSSVNVANFYSTLSNTSKRYDFTLTKLSSGSETRFTLIAIGDPQVSGRTTDPYYTPAGLSSTSFTYSNLWRFKNETMSDIANTIKDISTPVYGISMGDEVDTKYYSLQSSVKTVIGSTSMPVFSVIGNHDHYGLDDTYNSVGVDSYENAWGPRNYSFNRGNVHIVVMDNVLFPNASDLSSYTAGFTDDQVSWLRQDLSYVPKTKMVVLCYHIPLRNTNYQNRSAVLSLLSGYASVSLFCGHTHYNEICNVTTDITALEHIHGAACGAWWKSTLNTEGTPNGYEVYTIDGTNFTNWYYKSISRPSSFQMRLSTADCMYGGSNGYYSYTNQLSLASNSGYVVANIFNADARWTVKAYEGSSTTGIVMTRGASKPDAYAMGYHVGVLGRDANNYDGTNNHLYYYKRSDANAVVKVVATDEFGNEYTGNTFTSDFSEAMHY